ncbi:MAG: hypothetical protein LBJ77_03125, partial [Holosporales bacterium]|nr:hypothetical protein [Holosporales bacterium]
SETLTILPDEMLTIYVSGQTTLGAFYKFSSHKQDMWGAKGAGHARARGNVDLLDRINYTADHH